MRLLNVNFDFNCFHLILEIKAKTTKELHVVLYHGNLRTCRYVLFYPIGIDTGVTVRLILLCHLSMVDCGGVPGTRSPSQRVQILCFWHTKFPKRNHLGSPRPPMDILDPPLFLVFNKKLRTWFCGKNQTMTFQIQFSCSNMWCSWKFTL